MITRDTQIYDTGSIDVPCTYNEKVRTPYVCWKKRRARLDQRGAGLQQSCDVFFYQVAGPRQTDERGPADALLHPAAIPIRTRSAGSASA